MLTSGFLPFWPDFQGYKDIYSPVTLNCTQKFAFADIRPSPSLAGLFSIQGYLFATDIELYTEICLCSHQALSAGLSSIHCYKDIYSPLTLNCTQTFVFADIRFSPSSAGLSSIQGYKDIYSPLTLNCTQTFVFADIRFSPSSAGLSSIQGYKDIYSPLTFNCIQKFVWVTFHLYSALTNRQSITIIHI